VIRIRRQMLGISQQKLSEGVCTVRTLQRIEAGKSSPQRAVSTALFQRLGLSSQFIRQAYLADQLAMKDMVLRMSRLETDEEYQKEQKLFARMKEHMVEDENTNTQAVMRKDAYLRWRNGEIDLETFQAFVKEALEKTIPLDVVLKPGKRYLTDEERGCLTYLLLATEDGSGEQNSYRFVLEELYQSVPEEECYNSLMPMYNANMTQVSSICGNIGEYEKSDKIFDYIAQNSMMVRRGSQIPNVYYSNWWNDEQRRKCGIPAKYGNGREILEFAIDLAEFFDMKSSVELFKQKLR
jgi:transcriptional regulator with XRE-family HTH domain